MDIISELPCSSVTWCLLNSLVFVAYKRHPGKDFVTVEVVNNIRLCFKYAPEDLLFSIWPSSTLRCSAKQNQIQNSSPYYQFSQVLELKCSYTGQRCIRNVFILHIAKWINRSILLNIEKKPSFLKLKEFNRRK